MPGSVFGHSFRVVAFGESHGKCVGVVVDGCPAGLELSEEDVQKELDRRRPGRLPLVSPRVEEDRVEILSGVFRGRTTGAPICMIIWNRGFDSSPYEKIADLPRPGHADYPARVRYGGFNDYRGGGYLSGRLTASFVMAGAVAKKLLSTKGIEVLAHLVQVGGVKLSREVSVEEVREKAANSPVFCADPSTEKCFVEEIESAAREGDSVGGVVECLVLNLPAGIGDPLFDSIDADLAKILFDIPGVKGVEFGAGFSAASLKGSQNNDPYAIVDGRVVTTSNRAGGVLGGLTTGMPLVVRVAFKPTPSIRKPQRTINLRTLEEAQLVIEGRHDPCIAIRGVPVVEAMVAMVLADHMLRLGHIPTVLR